MARLEALNPHVRLIPYRSGLDADSLDAVVAQVDLVLDCTDNFAIREAVNAACVKARKPLVSGAAIRLEDSSPCSIRGWKPAPAITAYTGMAARLS